MKVPILAAAALLCAAPAGAAGKAALSARLTKSQGLFHFTGGAVFSFTYDKARPVLRDFAGYARWALSRINTRREGRTGRYLIRVDDLIYDEAQRRFRLKMTLDLFFKGRHTLHLLVEDGLAQASPRLGVTLERPSRLVKKFRGEIVFTERPDDGGIALAITGEAESHWAFYYLVPLGVLRVNLEERVLTVLENARWRITTVP